VVAQNHPTLVQQVTGVNQDDIEEVEEILCLFKVDLQMMVNMKYFIPKMIVIGTKRRK
jgi:hypothetical protein